MLTVIHHQPLIFTPPLFVHIILLQNKNLKWEEQLLVLLEVPVTEGFPIEIDDPRQPFYFESDVLNFKRKSNTVMFWVVADLKLLLTP